MLRRMHDWMLEAPMVKLAEKTVQQFQTALAARDATRLPADLPRWIFLDWLTKQGYLLHGSPKGPTTELRPQTKNYKQPDDFSNTIGVYAASDGLWALMYALRGPLAVKQLDMGLQVLEDGQWSRMKYFVSLAPQESGVVNGRQLLAPGYVYVLPREGFQQSPPYQHPGLGYIQEAHWVNPSPVRPLMCIPVRPDDFPLPVRVHDADQVDRLCESDPWGFPWLEAKKQETDG